MERRLMIIKIKPEYREKYIDLHLNPWDEILVVTKEAGFRSEIIWYYNNLSIIYFETEDDYFECDKRLMEMETSKKWEHIVNEWFEEKPILAEKIFDLNQMLQGKMDKY